MIKTVLLKSKSKIDGYILEVNHAKKTFSIGYAKNLKEHYKILKTTLKEFNEFIALLKNNSYTYKEKQWI